ncbi:hypothetical protein J5N97_020323 [Dioscorea zingiberensis]|uniref:4-coumarate--CoA ligase n=1 Tax=Dioscorea zingiberensis TaxID=325984 RepID=A0A9D5HDB6_9LILI|nr:hypothetical protein J5N97_020323 [Dioscorea zingiberensis]
MAAAPPSSIDPRSGFCSTNGVYYRLHSPPPLPPDSLPLSIASYALSLLPCPPPPNPAIIFSTSSSSPSITFPLLISQVSSLASELRSHLRISKGDVVYILAPTSLEIPILYIALLSIGAVVCPSNPLSTPDEIAHQVSLTNPSVAFTNAYFAAKLPSHLATVHLKSPLFRSFLEPGAPAPSLPTVEMSQYDPGDILYSSGTTGRVKGLIITHPNFITVIAAYYASREAWSLEDGPYVTLFTIPLFHVFGFFVLLRSVALGVTTVLMEKVDLEAILRAVHAHRVKVIPVSPPLVLALAKSDLVSKFDLSSLRRVGSGGAHLGRELAELFTARFPSVAIYQVSYGLMESTGSAASQLGPEECLVFESVGRISAGLEAKIVDPATGEVLPPGRQGELWLRGPVIMKGYIGDDEATASTLDSEGWLKTGDLCYFDQDGFLFIVDRLKELIKYKAYQVPPAELEKILLSHPKIADAAVIPYPNEEAGQIPMAFVIRRPQSTFTEKQIIDFVAKQVSPYKKIRRVAFVSSIPKSAAGKILRRELVKYALSSPRSKL